MEKGGHPARWEKLHIPFLPKWQSLEDDRNNPSPENGKTPNSTLHHPVAL